MAGKSPPRPLELRTELVPCRDTGHTWELASVTVEIKLAVKPQKSQVSVRVSGEKGHRTSVLAWSCEDQRGLLIKNGSSFCGLPGMG